MFRRFFKFTLAIACVAILALLAVACSGEEDEPTPTPFTGHWSQFDDTDPITDKGRIGIRLSASDGDVETGFLGVRLYVRCTDSEELDIYVIWSNDVGEELVVDWRVDSNDPNTEVWYPTIDEDNDVTFHPDPKSAIDDLRNAGEITIRLYSDTLEDVNFAKKYDDYSYLGEAMTAVFHPAGFEDAYKPVAEVCGR